MTVTSTDTADRLDNDTDLPCPGWHPDRDAPGLPVWCRPCQDDIIAALHRLPGHVADLASRPDGRTSPLTGGRVQYEGEAAASRPNGAAPASPSPAWDAIDKTIHHVLTLEDTVRDIADMPPAERLTPAHGRYRGLAGDTADRYAALTAAIDWLTDYRTALLTLDDAWRIGHDLLTLDRTLERLTGQDRLTHRLPVPCPKCNHLSLVRKDGDDKVRCTNKHACGLVWREDQYAWFTRVAADNATEGAARAAS